MAIRFIPFGYEIFDAKIKVIEEEAEIVRNIFGLYVQGMSLKEISDRLNLLPIKYAEGKRWDKNNVKRILENPKYTGDKNYPVIVPTEIAKMALAIKKEKYRFAEEEDKKRIDVYHAHAKCAVCGGKMIRVCCRSGKYRYIYWKCNSAECIGNQHVLNEKILNSAIADILNGIADDLETIQVEAYKSYDKDESIVYAENALHEIMESNNKDTSEVVSKMLELASAKFNRCKHGDCSALTKRIERCMAVYPHRDVPDDRTINDIIKRIKISPLKTITVELINGKEFTREHQSKR